MLLWRVVQTSIHRAEIELRKTCLLQERELEERELEKRRQESIRAIIEEERQKLLKEHAWKLLGYLPRVSELYFKYF